MAKKKVSTIPTTGELIKNLLDAGRISEAQALMNTLHEPAEDDENIYVAHNQPQPIEDNSNTNGDTFSTKTNSQRIPVTRVGSTLARVEPWTKPKKMHFESGGVPHEFLNYPKPITRQRPVQQKYVYECSVCHKKEKHFPSEVVSATEGMMFKCNSCCTT